MDTGTYKFGKHLKNVPQPLLESMVTGNVVPVVGTGFARNGGRKNGWLVRGVSVHGVCTVEISNIRRQ